MNKKNKLIVWLVGLILTLLMILISVDFLRYRNNQKPIFIFKTTHYDYDDGYVNEYYGIGYKYFEYRRNKLDENSLVPFWSPMKR